MNYLSGKTQRTRIDGVISGDEAISYGVPPGSVFGPTLFTIYVNELCGLNIPHGRIFSYADDTALIFVGKTWEEARSYAETGLKIVTEWLSDNQLTLNVEKTKFLPFNNSPHRTPDLDIKVHKNCHKPNCVCPSLQCESKLKYLGVVLDSRMSWKPHIDLLCSRVRKLIYVFKNLRDAADRKTVFNVYDALCKPILTYCITSWGGACTTHILPLERAQRAILKVATFKPYRFNTYELYNDCGVLTVRQLFIHSIITLQHKQRSTVAEFKNKKSRRKEIVFEVPLCNSKLAHRHALFLGPYIYNKANKIIVELTSKNNSELRYTIKNWLKSLSPDDTAKFLKVIYS